MPINFPDTEGQLGDGSFTYTDPATGVTYRFFRSDPASTTGPGWWSAAERGQPGATGATGPGAGSPGAPGDPGATGVAGATGPAGATGAQGPPGQGNPGLPGDPGATGPTGSPGGPGFPGPRGATGPQGAPGLPGSVGTLGATGATGIGSPGSPGGPGATGPAGPTGNPGGPGFPGGPGATGPAGTIGPPGIQGERGATGLIEAYGPTFSVQYNTGLGAGGGNSGLLYDGNTLTAANEVTADVSGYSSRLNPGRNINTVAFDGTQDITITALTDGVLSMGTTGNGLSGSQTFNGNNATFTVASNGTSSNIPNTLVFRDGTGSFFAQEITTVGDITVGGDLTVQGTEFIIESETVVVADKNIFLGVTTGSSDVTADGGGVILEGTTDKSLLWFNATNRWTSNEDFQAPRFYGPITGDVTGNVLGNVIGDVTGDLTGNADTADRVNNSLTVATSGNGLTGSGTFDGSAAVNVTVNSNATSANTANTIVYRNASGAFNATTVNANLVGDVTGNVLGSLDGQASLAGRLNPGATINGVLFDGSQAITIDAGTPGTLTLDTSGIGLSGGLVNFNGSNASFTVTSNATSANNASTIVARDGNGDFLARNITALGAFIGDLTGNADTATNADFATDAADSTNAENILVEADNSSVQEKFLLFTDTQSGNQRAKNDSGLLYNPSLNRITASAFQGTLTGNSSSASQLNVGNNDTNGNYPFVFALNTSVGNKELFTDSAPTCYINPSNNTIGASVFIGDLTGNATSADTATSANSLNTANNYQVSSFGVGTAPSGIAGEIRATNDITAFFSSDRRLKRNIKPIPQALDKVSTLSGNTFDWLEGHETVHSHEGADCGVIAQEVEALEIPGLVTDRDNGFKAVKYEKLVPLLIEAIKELKDEVNDLRGQINGNS